MLPEERWYELIDLITCYINNKPNPRRMGLSPNAIHTARDQEGNPLIRNGERLINIQRQEGLIPVLVDFKFIDPPDETIILTYLNRIAEEMDKVDKKVYELFKIISLFHLFYIFWIFST